VVEGETGMLVPSENSEALAQSITTLLLDKDRARALGQRGRARVEQRFQITMMINEYQRLYQKCLGE
jgi:glycosyltransferase involved in cell wall biosynthesis